MRRMIRSFESLREKAEKERQDEVEKSSPTKRQYRINGRSFRRAVVIALAAVLLAALVACGVRWVIIWNETQNDKQGTLDITFDIEGKKNTSQGFETKRPKAPQGFEIVQEEKTEAGEYFSIIYQNKDNEIYYSQNGAIENMGLSIDNDDEGFTEISVNGYKGYALTKGDAPYMIWCDGEYLYYLSGTVPYEVLEEMAQSLS